MRINSIKTRIAHTPNSKNAKGSNFKAFDKQIDDIYLRLAQASLRDKMIENELKMMGLI